MNFVAINNFRDHVGNVHVPAGVNVLGSGQLLSYPEYNGDKEGLFDFYQAHADKNGWSAHKLNDTMYQIFDNINFD